MKFVTIPTIVLLMILFTARVSSALSKREKSSLESQNKEKSSLTGGRVPNKAAVPVTNQVDKKSTAGAAPAVNVPVVEDEDPSVSGIATKANKFIIFGDTGQADAYFADYVKRTILDNCVKRVNGKYDTALQDICAGVTDVKEFPAIREVKFTHFEKLLAKINGADYQQGVILGDFVYTENKKAGIGLENVWDSKAKKAIITLATDHKVRAEFKRKMFYRDGVNVENEFNKRLVESVNYVFQLLTNKDKKLPPFILLSGNHSFDVDDKVERKVISEIASTSVRMFKHSKVHITDHACFGDLSFGDLSCLHAASYEECFAGPLMQSRAGRDEKDTLTSFVKVIEAALTLKLCKSRWRIIRTHAAPFNTEIDQITLFRKTKYTVTCSVRAEIDGLKLKAGEKKNITDLLTILDTFTGDLTAEKLAKSSTYLRPKTSDKPEKEKIENRVFSCEAVLDKDPKETISVMEIVDRTDPHFYLASHLHAQQLLYAPRIQTLPEEKGWFTGKEIKTKQGCWQVKNLAIANAVKLEELQNPNRQTKCDETTIQHSMTILDKPAFNTIFVIGNSGRFLDGFFDGRTSVSDVVWQRINVENNLQLAAAVIDSKSKLVTNVEKGKTNDTFIKSAVDEIKKADDSTAYGFSELTTISDKEAIVEFKELTSKGLISVLKVNIKKGDKNPTAYGGSKEANLNRKKLGLEQIEAEKKKKDEEEAKAAAAKTTPASTNTPTTKPKRFKKK